VKKICPNCSESIEILSKDGFCYNCQNAYEIGVIKKGQSPYVYSMYVFASKCIILIILGLSLLFVATRFELNISPGVSSGNPCEKQGAFTENKGIEYQCADDPSTMAGSIWRQSRELIEEEKQNTEYILNTKNLKEVCLERKILEKKEGIQGDFSVC
jgi:hypothetical protein